MKPVDFNAYFLLDVDAPDESDAAPCLEPLSCAAGALVFSV